jgi:hypothetical protein
MPEFYPDIHDYLESVDNSKSVKTSSLGDIALKIRAHTGISKDASELILKHFFQEIRSAMLRGDVVSMKGFGKFFVSSPQVSGNKKRIFPKFRPHKPLIRQLND